MIQICWIDVYTSPPNIIVHDAGTNFDSAEFRHNTGSMAIHTKCVPVEAPQSVSLIKQYHGLLRHAYNIITEELGEHTTTKEMRLQMAVKAVNDTTGPDGLIPTLLVFGTFPQISHTDPPAPSVTQHAAAIKAAMTEIGKLHAKRQVSDALQQ